MLVIVGPRIIRQICHEVENSIQEKRFLKEFKTSGLPTLSEKMDGFLNLLVSSISASSNC